MSLHVRMTDEADKALRWGKRRNLLLSFLTASLAICLIGLMLYMAVIVIASPEKAEVTAYVASDEDAPPSDRPVVPERAAVRPPTARQSHANIITLNTASSVSVATVDIDTELFDPGLNRDLDLDLAGSLGSDPGEGGTGFGTDKPGGSTLEGDFYDLKQTPGGVDTQMTYEGYLAIMHQFIKTWNTGSLGKYYKSPTKLYASQFYIPNSPSEDAAKAYKCSDRVKGSLWMAVYKGNVIAPKSGQFRFVGAADDVIVVRFNGTNVFDFGWSQVAPNQTYTVGKTWHDALQDAKGADKGIQKKLRDGGINIPPVTLYKYANTEHWNANTGGYAAGPVFTVEAGKTYPIAILMADNGGEFGVSLMIEEVGATVEKKDSKYGSPIFPLFRTNYSLPDPKSIKGQVAPFDPVGIVWQAVK